MNPVQMPPAEQGSTSPTGLPGLHSWRGVYFVVLGILAVWVVLLTLLPRLFS